MRCRSVLKYLVGFVIVLGVSTVTTAQYNPSLPRQRLLMDFGWKFAFGHRTEREKDFYHSMSYFSYLAKAGYGDGPAAKDFDDRSWRSLDLPHDWAVEVPFDSTASYSHGYKAVGWKFPQTSIGWYRKTFSIPHTEYGKRFFLTFDGVFRNARVWFNGFYLGEEQSGYYGFSFDITDYIDYGGNNVVAVRVDATQEEGWFYEGAGIYRHVWLTVVHPLHLSYDDIFIRSQLVEGTAHVILDAVVVNKSMTPTKCSLELIVTGSDEGFIARKQISELFIRNNTEHLVNDTIHIFAPRLWSVETPYLYRMYLVLRSQGMVIDSVMVPFGIRTLHFDPEKGFFLNGKHVYLKGTNNHQDHAGVGVALPDGLQEFRIRKLKEMGCNAYRCSHNPPTPELLDVCDRLGMLVIDEHRLMGTTHEHLDLLKRLIRRDRNHPSVILWSIGNEEWAIEGNEFGARIAQTMQRFVKSLDPTRPVTYANSGGWGHGISTVQEIMGYNYIFNGNIDEHHRKFPHQPSLGTEESTSRGTRGVYRTVPARAHLAQIDREHPEGLSIEKGLRFYAERPFLAGLFFWTGFDYRGECSPFGWPQVTSQYGLLDLCGFPKDMFYFLQAHWTEDPVLHVFPHWNWTHGDTVRVWVYSNCDQVELELNGKSLGIKTIPRYSHGEWLVPYKAGTLTAHGYRNGTKVLSTVRKTTGAPASIQLLPDKHTLKANREDIAVITVQVVDKEGNVVPTANEEIFFTLQGPARILGVGNGNPSSHEPDTYFEAVKHIFIENLKGKNVVPSEAYNKVLPSHDCSQWQSMVDEQGNYALKPHPQYSVVVIRGTFRLPSLPSSARITLWPQVLCEEQDIYINGHKVALGLKRGERYGGYSIPHEYLREGENIYAVVGPPLVPRYQYDNLNTIPGWIQLTIPAPQWKRTTFNGYAQIILQATNEPGTITLIASSSRLKSSTVTVHSQKAEVRHYIPSLE